MKKVLVIVVTYNGLKWLDRCLGSVMPGVTGHLQTDLYVFDNDSTDGSADFVARHYPQAKLVRSADNLGFSKPNNLGMQYALDKGYEYVYLLNQDAWLEPGALEKLVAAAGAHPEFGVLSPLQMTEGYKALDREFGKILRRDAPQYKANESSEDMLAVKRVMAAHWLVPVAAIRCIGLFNEALFPFYGQDDDWCNRLYYCGLKVGVVPAARAVHDRAYRQEPRERVVFRNYYTGSLVRLAHPGRPLWLQWTYVLLFTLVKTVRYRSLLPFHYLKKLFGQAAAIKEARMQARSAR